MAKLSAQSRTRRLRRLKLEQLEQRALLNADLPADFVLTIIHNNDGESQLINAAGQPDFGGVARFKTLVDDLRAEAADDDDDFDSDGILTLSSGDNFLAGPEFTASLNTGPLGGRTYYDAIALSAIGYDAIQLGNHDFDFGPDLLADFIPQVTTPPYLAANLDFSAGPGPGLDTLGQDRSEYHRNTRRHEYRHCRCDHRRACHDLQPPATSIVNPVLPAVQVPIDDLQSAGVDKIVLISHLQSINEELALIPQLSGVDVVIAGGGDELLANPGDLLVPGDTPHPAPYPS